MLLFDLTIRSKNLNSIQNFLRFFYKNISGNFYFYKNFILKKTKKKVVTVLKSPHVNKIAQEQFEIRLHTVQFKMITTQPLKLLLFLKKVKVFTVSDVSIKLKTEFNQLNNVMVNTMFFKTANSNFKLNFIKTKLKKKFKKLFFLTDNQKTLKLLDIFGNSFN